MHPDGKVVEKELGGIKEGESIMKAYSEKRIFFSIKIQKNV